jgi:hypothetical protein
MAKNEARQMQAKAEAAIENDLPADVVSIKVPISPLAPNTFVTRGIAIGRMSMTQAIALKGVARALEDKGAKYEGRRPVKNAQGAVRWILEQIGNQNKGE